MDYLVGSVGGIVVLLVKYFVVGLTYWDVLHPGRIEPESLKDFKKPFLLGRVRVVE